MILGKLRRNSTAIAFTLFALSWLYFTIATTLGRNWEQRNFDILILLFGSGVGAIGVVSFARALRTEMKGMVKPDKKVSILVYLTISALTALVLLSLLFALALNIVNRYTI